MVVVDACGVGALPDAADYGDAGANTLLHVAEAVGGLALPVLGRARARQHPRAPRASAPSPTPVLHGRLHALGPGKDSTAGHWELVGVVAQRRAARPSRRACPRRCGARVEAAIGTPVICNRAYNGVAAIEDYGEEHLVRRLPDPLHLGRTRWSSSPRTSR